MLAFISHNKRDKAVAREIAVYLAAENINVWFDEWQVSAGDSIIEEIEKGLLGCSHFLIVWSKNAASSNWVRKELSSALSKAISEGSIKVIPIVLDSTPLPPLISDLKYIRYENGTEADRNHIVKSITGQAPTQDYIRAIVKKYHEVIADADSGDPFPLRACPKCGSTRLKRESATDYEHDDVYYLIRCKECTWSEWTQ